MSNVLSVSNLCKSYSGKPVVKNVSFSVEPGQIVGLVGPNGSGKTTIIKIINSLITDYTGTVHVCGKPLGIAAKRALAYLPDREFLREDTRVDTFVSLYADFFHDFDRQKAHEMLDSMKIDRRGILRKLSKGMREKVALVLTMARKASLYIFDEPIAAVDPAAREFIIQTIIRNYNEEGAVLFCTHLIADVEPILGRVIFLKEGELLIDSDADTLRESRNQSIDQIFREEFRC